MSILLTGASGFVGSNLKKHLDVISMPDDIDICQSEQINKYVSSISPDYVIHLAGQSFVPRSFENPLETFEINFAGTFNLLNALKESKFKGRFLYVGSGDVYGLLSEESLPVSESLPLKPRNPYSVSKVAAETLCYQWSQTEDFDVIMARPFNHIGPGQSEVFAISSFAKQIIEIKKEKRNPELSVGDIGVTRDFTDVSDVVHAYELLLSKGQNGEVYNICSGKEILVSDIISQLINIADVEVEIKKDKALSRPSENRRIFGDNAKIKETTGWQPEISLQQSLKDIIDDWEQKLK